jgi:hypothetical protein
MPGHGTARQLGRPVTVANADPGPSFRAGAAPSPGLLTVPPDRLSAMLGLREVRYVETPGPLAAVDYTLEG